MEIDEGKLGGAALVAWALAGVARNTGVQASAPAAAAPARKARRDGPLAGLSVRIGSGSWRGCIGSPRYMNQAPRGPSAPWVACPETKHALGWFRCAHDRHIRRHGQGPRGQIWEGFCNVF